MSFQRLEYVVLFLNTMQDILYPTGKIQSYVNQALVKHGVGWQMKIEKLLYLPLM